MYPTLPKLFINHLGMTLKAFQRIITLPRGYEGTAATFSKPQLQRLSFFSHYILFVRRVPTPTSSKRKEQKIAALRGNNRKRVRVRKNERELQAGQSLPSRSSMVASGLGTSPQLLGVLLLDLRPLFHELHVLLHQLQAGLCVLINCVALVLWREMALRWVGLITHHSK